MELHEGGVIGTHSASGFASLHPAVVFGWFLCAMILVVVVGDPLWIGCACAGAAALCLMERGRAGLRLIAAMVPLLIVLSLVNGLVDPQGETVLFTYLSRPFTAQAVLYGMQTAGMLVCVLLLFSSYDRMMTSDRFTYLFGGAAPSLTLILTMALRFVPDYLRKARQISRARECIGMGAADGSVRLRVRNGADILGALTTWALEAGIITADSMRSRGYGTASRRTRFAHHPFGMRDAVSAASMALLVALSIAGMLQGTTSVEYLPRIVLPPVTPLGVVAFASFVGFMLVPFAIDVGGRISWRNSLSRI